MDFENGEVQLNEENISKDKSTKQNISMKRRSKKQERNSKAIHKEIAKAATEPQKSIYYFKINQNFQKYK
jgi:hypothetical protein